MVSDDDLERGGKTSFNEKAKLTASFLNGVALTVLTVGGLSPFVLQLQGRQVELNHALFALGCLALSGVIHLVARNVLDGMLD
ncbi:MAG: hypothetical protein ACO1OG_00895 [Devosia sp.]